MKYGFDSYGIQARLRPALLALFPLFMAAAIWFPDVYKIASGLVGLAVACGLTVILGQLSRNQGLKAQNKLMKEWGEMPTTKYLRHLDSSIDEHTKARYHAFLEDKIPNWETPTRTEEMESPEKIGDRYRSAVRWLREHTRDTKKYPLVFNENTSYGFRRNAFGIKYFGIIISLSVCVFLLEKLTYFSLKQLISEEIQYFLVALLSIALLFWWIFGVTKKSVYMAAQGYARALLAVCDKFD